MQYLIVIILILVGHLSAFILPNQGHYLLHLNSEPSSQQHPLYAATKEPETIANIGPKQHGCQFCSEEFDSRNALFRHVRNSEYCASQAKGGKDVSPYCLKRNDVVISIAYDAFLTTTTDQESSKIRIDCDAKVVGEVVKKAFLQSIETLYKEEISTSNDDEDLTPKIMSSTQTSVANQRHHSLSKENGVGSIGEVMTISYTYPVRKTLKDEKKGFRDEEEERALRKIVPFVRDYLKQFDMADWRDELEGSAVKDVQLLSARIVANTKLHAEMSCTQRAYHYILPLRWLQGGRDVETWWLESRDEVIQRGDANEWNVMRAKRPPPNNTLRTLKEALRSAECKTVTKEAENLASGRYGVLGLKQRRPWHNFANPQLQGDASPSNKPVWRVLDRCRIFQFVPFENGDDTELMAVIEFRGDDFVLEQVRRIIGSAVAITNGWLPEDFIDTATQSELFVETPLAPPNLMYFADARFHFDELIQGKRLFENVNDSDIDILQAMNEIQEIILNRTCDPSIQSEHIEWLASLKNTISRRIQDQLESTASRASTSELVEIKLAPPAYTDTLSVLRGIITGGRWPTTSVARSRVIKSDDCTTFKSSDEVIESGSFTIINPKFNDGELMDNDKIRIPLGNKAFPGLVDAIFGLEASLSKDPDSGVHERPWSSHCAVNRNAQFTPHVDSGRGAGQSLSMIVGLGDYSGGELLIESEPAEIRYSPIEFDGWKCRHWTAPFNGERYSLVWFTPEM